MAIIRLPAFILTLMVVVLLLALVVEPLQLLWTAPPAISAIMTVVVLWWAIDRVEETGFSAREVSVVATLGALAAVLRIPFAAIPGVQPTTFLVFATGYVFGMRSGFLVGMLSALLSNFFLPKYGNFLLSGK